MEQAFIIDALRTPIGKFGGSLSGVRPDDLLSIVIKELMNRNPQVDPAAVEDVIAGCANQAGEDNRNVARMSLLLAGLPATVAGTTVNRLCASGLQSIMDAARAVMCGEGDVYLAGGVESMSRAPYVMGKPEVAFSRKPEVFDTTIGWRFPNKKLSDRYYPYSMGETAEHVAERWKIKREAQDAFALESQEKYFAALQQGKWKEEIVPVSVPAPRGQSEVIDTDEHPRKTSLEKLAQLKPAFRTGGTVTAGNSSGINDGASMLLIASEAALKRWRLQPIAAIKSVAVAGVDPAVMGIGPVPATNKCLYRAGINVSDLDIVELNEAFASQSLACIRELQVDPTKVNVNGGAIAMGHPLGCSGARIATTLLYEMRRRRSKYGLATMCVGVGQGAAVVFENIV